MKQKIYSVILFLIAVTLFGQQYNFTGAGDGSSWDDPTNWSPSGVPFTGTNPSWNVVIDAGQTAIIPIGLSLNFTAGQISGPGKIINKGTLSIGNESFARTLGGGLIFENEGSFLLGTGVNVYAGYQVFITNDSKVTNKAGGTIVSNGRGFAQSGGNDNVVFENKGTLQKLGNWSRDFSANMKNTGTIDVQFGTLVFNPTTSYLETGTYNVSLDAALTLNGKHYIKGVWSGVVNGTFYFNFNPIIVAANDTLTNNITGNGILFISGHLQGPGFNNADTGYFINNTTFVIDGNNTKYIEASIEFTNNGTMNWGTGNNLYSGYDFRIDNDSKLINNGVINGNGIGVGQAQGTDNVAFENQGTINKLGDWEKAIWANMENTGTINVLFGELRSSGADSYLEGGVYNVSTNALLNLTGKHHLEGSFTGLVEGSFQWNSDDIFIDSDETATNNITGNGILFNSGKLLGPGLNIPETGNFVNNTTFTIDGNNTKYFGTSIKFTNNGTMNWGTGTEQYGGYDFRIDPDSKLINTTSGIIISHGVGVGTPSGIGTTIVFENQGLIRKLGNWSRDIWTSWKNTGTVQVEEGRLGSSNGDSYFVNGTYNVFAGATLDLTGRHHLEGNLGGTVNGSFQFNFNPIVVDADKTATNNITGNGILFNSGHLQGPGFNNADTGYFINNTTFVIDGNNTKYIEASIEFTNNGTMNWGTGINLYSGYDFRIDNDSKLINNGIINGNGAGVGQAQGTDNVVFENQGTINKLGDWEKAIWANMENTGTLNVLEGELRSSGADSYLDGGIYNVSTNALLNLTGKHHLEGSFTGLVDGSFQWNSDDIFIDSDETATNNITGNGILFSSGKLLGPGLNIPETGNFVNNTTFTIDGNNTKYFGTSIKFTNNGTMNWGTGTERYGGYDFRIDNDSKLINSATGVITSNGVGVGQNLGNSNVVFENAGLVKKLGNWNRSVVAKTSNTGTIEAREGNFALYGLTNETSGIVKGVKVWLQNDLSNHGSFNPGLSPGVMTVENFFSMDGGTLEFELNGLASGTEYDVMNYTGNVIPVLNGTIKPILGFEAAIGDTFTVFTSVKTITATLPATVVAPYQGKNYFFSVTVNPNNIILEVTDIVDIVYDADFYVNKSTSTTEYTPGGSIIYTIEVGNNSVDPLDGYEQTLGLVSDALPVSIPAVNMSYTAVAAGGAATSVVGSQTGAIADDVDIPVGGTVTYTVTIDIPISYMGDLTNIATVAARGTLTTDSVLDNNTSEVVTPRNPNFCTGTPEAGIATTTPNTGDPNSTYTVSATGYSEGADGLSYMWYYSTDGGNTWEFYDSDETYFDVNATAPGTYNTEVRWQLAVYCLASDSYGYSEEAVFTTGDEPNNDCTGTPEAGIATTTPNTGDPNSTYTVSATGYSEGVDGLSYMWYYSTDGGNTWEFYDSDETYFDVNATAPGTYNTEVRWQLTVYCLASDSYGYSEEAVFTTGDDQNSEDNIWANGQWSKGIPINENLPHRKLIFRSDFVSVKDGNNRNTNGFGRIWGTSAVVEAGVNVVFESEYSLVLDDELIVDSDNGASITFKSGASLGQKNNFAINQGIVDFERNFNISANVDQYNLVISPVTNFDIQNVYPGGPLVYRLNETTNNFVGDGVGSYVPGKGFRVDEAGSQGPLTGVFTGIPANGYVNFPMTVNGSGMNLTGNPYPSILLLNRLWSNNSAKITPSFYFWDNRGNTEFNSVLHQIAVYNASSQTGSAAMGPVIAGYEQRIPNGEVSVGSGFAVQATQSSMLKFQNAQRKKIDSDEPEFFGKPAAKDRYWLTMTTPDKMQAMTAVVYFGEGNNGFGIEDSKSIYGDDIVYTLVNDNQLVIQGKAPFSTSDVVPMGVIINKDGKHTIALIKQEGVFENGQNVYLRDKATGVVHNLSEKPYQFTATAGQYNDRFEIIYNGFTDVMASTGIKIEKKDHNIVISSTDKNIVGVEIFNLAGLPVYSKSDLNTKIYSVPVSLMPNQVVVVSVKTDTGEIVNKKFVNQQ